jgi:hypothetical protein
MNPIVLFQLNNTLLALCSAVVGALVIVSFDKPVILDFSFIALLFMIGLMHFRNRNIISLFLILILDRLVSYSISFMPEANLLTKCFTYLSVIGFATLLRYQSLSKWVLASLLITLPAEIVWYITGYEAPPLYSYYMGITQIVILRYFLLMRMGYFCKWKSIVPQQMDYTISELMLFSGWTQLFVLTESWLRHLLGIDIMWIYRSYGYVQHSISALLIMAILFYTLWHPHHTMSRPGVLKI